MLKLQANNYASFVKSYNDNDSIDVYDYYQTTEDGKLYKTLIAKWRQKRTSTYNKQDFTKNIRSFNPWRERKNLSEIFLNCIVIPDSYYVTIENSKEEILIKGSYGNIWQYVKQYLQFRQTNVVSKENIYGNYDTERKSWTGIIQDLLEKRYNISLSHLSITFSRSKVIDFLLPLEINKLEMFYNYPKKQEQNTIDSSFTHFVNEFSSLTWIYVAVIFVSFVIFLKLLLHFHPKEEMCSCSEAFLLVFSLFCNTGYERNMKTISGRIFFITASMTFFLLFSYYTSFLISSLTTNHRKIPFKNLQGLYEHKGEYKISTLGESAVVEMLQDSSMKVMRKIWKEMKYSNEETFPTTVNDLFSLVSKEKVVGFLGTKSTSLASKENFLTFPLPTNVISAWVIPKDFPFKRIFNCNLLRLIEGGINNREERLLYEANKRKKKSKRSLVNDSWEPIHFKSVFLPIGLLLLGMGVSMIILFIENKEALRLYLRNPKNVQEKYTD